MSMKRRKSQIARSYEIEMIWAKRQAPGPHECVLVLDHLKAGFNVGKIIRSANALGCHSVHLVGIGLFDTATARGTLKQTRVLKFDSISESIQSLRGEGYTLYAFDPSGERVLGQEPLPEKCAFILGHEEFGLSFKREEFPEIRWVKIPQVGTVQSMNVSVVASIGAFEYIRQHPKDLQASP